MNFGWHTRYHQDALDGMLILTLEERGAYNTCLDLIYARQGPIPDDPRWLSGWMGCSLRMWKTLRATLIVKGKLYATDADGEPRLMNQRAAIELENAAKLARNSRETGAKGGRKRAENEAARKEIKDIDQGGLKGASTYRQDIDSKKISEAKASSSPASPRRLPDEPFELCWKAYPHIRGRSSKTKSLAAWRRLSVPVRSGLLGAVTRYAKQGREPNSECGAPAMERWIRDERYADWMGDDPPPGTPLEPPTPEQIAWRMDRYRDTGEWKTGWGERPKDAA